MPKASVKKIQTPVVKAAYEAGRLQTKDASCVMMGYEALSRAQTAMKTVEGSVLYPLTPSWPSVADVLTADQLATLNKFLAMKDELAEIEASLRAYCDGRLDAWREQLDAKRAA
jgi:hypothetical protein